MIDRPDTPMPSSPPLTTVTEEERTLALERFHLLRPYLEDNTTLVEVADGAGLSVRTVRYWAHRYRQQGLAGLARKTRRDKNQPRIAPHLLQLIEGLALQKPPLSAAAIQRQVATVAGDRGQRPPSYSLVYAVVRKIEHRRHHE